MASPRMSPRPLPGGSQSAPAGLSLSSQRQPTSPMSSPRRVAVPPLLGSNSSYAGAFGYADPGSAGVLQSPSSNAPNTPSPRTPGLPRPYSPGPVMNMPSTPTASPAPCSTLYVKNLALSTTEQDALNLFRPQAGFRKLKLQSKPSGALMLFVEFVDAVHSAQAMQNLQNAMLNSSSIRVEFARHKMGESSSNLLLPSSGSIVPPSPRTYSQQPPLTPDHSNHSPRTQQNGNGAAPILSSSPGPAASQPSNAGGNASQAGMFVVHPSNQHYNL